MLVVAKTPGAYDALGRAFRERRVEKAYRAVVSGKLARDSGTIDAPVGRAGRRFAVSRLGRKAITHYEVLDRAPGATLVEARPITGRTHQIRAHLAMAGHPVAGDADFAGSRLPAPPRMMLHAFQLKFPHPSTDRAVVVSAPVPSDLAAYWKSLKGTGRTVS